MTGKLRGKQRLAKNEKGSYSFQPLGDIKEKGKYYPKAFSIRYPYEVGEWLENLPSHERTIFIRTAVMEAVKKTTQ